MARRFSDRLAKGYEVPSTPKAIQACLTRHEEKGSVWGWESFRHPSSGVNPTTWSVYFQTGVAFEKVTTAQVSLLCAGLDAGLQAGLDLIPLEGT
jgi:hypothetical protein